jgi:hypothetical protein
MSGLSYRDIELAPAADGYLYKGQPIFSHLDIEEGLKFHSEGLAAVKILKKHLDGDRYYIWKHINTAGNFIYPEQYQRVFGYYFGKAAVNDFGGNCFHINTAGKRVYDDNYTWAGNYQQDKVVVRADKLYFHLDKNGQRYYNDEYIYAGDYKDGFAVVKMSDGYYNHIDLNGHLQYENSHFLDLGVFHKNIATARDERGYHHTDKNGRALYKERYMQVEPFYNGAALVTNFDHSRLIIAENGDWILSL